MSDSDSSRAGPCSPSLGRRGERRPFRSGPRSSWKPKGPPRSRPHPEGLVDRRSTARDRVGRAAPGLPGRPASRPAPSGGARSPIPGPSPPGTGAPMTRPPRSRHPPDRTKPRARPVRQARCRPGAVFRAGPRPPVRALRRTSSPRDAAARAGRGRSWSAGRDRCPRRRRRRRSPRHRSASASGGGRRAGRCPHSRSP